MERIAHPPAVSEQIGVGFVTALLMAVADTAVATGGSGPQATAWDWIRAGLHLVALELPLGVVAGVAAGLALVALRAAPWAAPLRRHFDSRRALLAHAPE
ncbi:MAG: hypothetical protein ACOC5B_03495, partial [Myxococcota bacterium]